MNTFYVQQSSSAAGELAQITDELDRISAWRCAHPATELRVHIASNAARHYCFQCTTCGEKVRTVKKHEINQAEPPLIDNSIAESFRRRRTDRREQLQHRRMELMRSLHNEYLRSDQWREKRSKVLSREQGVCQGCMDAQAKHVHHITYKRWGNELLIDLVGLCETCHARCHADSDLEDFLSWLCQQMDMRVLNLTGAYT